MSGNQRNIFSEFKSKLKKHSKNGAELQSTPKIFIFFQTYLVSGAPGSSNFIIIISINFILT